jgi:hypothetical protein
LARVFIRGGGLAALTLARRLDARRISFALDGEEASGPSHIVLSQDSRELLADIWDWRPQSAAGAWSVAGRFVKWGRAPPVYVPQPVVAVDPARLKRDLQARLPASPPRDPAGSEWIVDTGGDLADGGGDRFGERFVTTALAAPRCAVPDFSILESVGDLGWLYLAPVGADRLMVQAMQLGAPGDATVPFADFVARAGLANAFVGELIQAPVSLDATPALSRRLAGDGRLRLGRAAAVLDPICGGGTAFSLRSALVAASSLAMAAGRARSGDQAFAHYARRLASAFADHLITCAALYREGHLSSAWTELLDQTDRRMRDLDLKPTASAAFSLRLVRRSADDASLERSPQPGMRTGRRL